MEHYARFDAELFRKGLQGLAVLVAFAPANIRMCRSGHDVESILVLLENAGHGTDDVLDPLVGRQQPERENHIFAFRSDRSLIKIRIHEMKVGNAVRDEVNLRGRYVIDVLQELL